MPKNLLPLALARPVVTLAVLTCGGGAWAGDPAQEQAAEHDPTVFPEQGTSTKMLLTGAAIAVGWYGAGVGTSYLWPDSPGASDLRVPVVGPFAALSKTGCGNAEGSCNTFTLILRTILTTLSAVGQVGGVAIMGEALLFPSPATQPTAPRAHALELRRDAPGVDSLLVVPLVTEDNGVGLSLTAEF